MTLEAFVAITSMLCGINFNSPEFDRPKEDKETCIENVTNCVIGLDGMIDLEKAEQCAKKRFVR